MPARRALAAAALAVLACGPAGPAAPDGGGGATRDADDLVPAPDADPAACSDAVDVVFVLDVSSSMGFVLADLGAGIAAVVDATNALAPDAHFGLVAFADNAALDHGGALEDGVVHTAAATLSAAFADVRATYTEHDRNPGDGPGGPELQNPICEEDAPDALHLAATGFPWREHATHVVIVATDDTFLAAGDNYGDRDHDGDTTSTSFPREGDYPAAHGIGDATLALREREIRVFSFTRLAAPGIDELLSRCSTGRRLDWSQVTDGWTTPYAGAAPFPDATDGGNFDLVAVRDGALSLADTIAEVVVGSHCDVVE